MSNLDTLAEAVGVARLWRDARGEDQRVTDEPLAAVLTALGYAADSDATIRASIERREDERRVPLLLTADAGWPTALPDALSDASMAELIDEHGVSRRLAIAHGSLPPVDAPGYYELAIAGRQLTLAVAPPRCFGIEAVSNAKLWGPAVQIYALRDRAEQAFGGFGELASAAGTFGGLGADMLAISPVHALYPGSGSHVSPYSPSSRLFLNTAFADPALAGLPPLAPTPATGLIDWSSATPARLAGLRASYARVDETTKREIAIWAAGKGEALQRHALFDALFCRFLPDGAYSWHGWPAAYHDADGEAARAFAQDNADEIGFHLFAQWLADKGLACAQANARDAGMALGLISDLAVGVDPGGSDGWSLGRNMLRGLSIGAPPDPLGPGGQNWGLTSFSPQGLQATGFAPWIAMLRTALAHAGGVRIDHAFGLSRLWLVPHGGGAGDGAYLSYPFVDLQRLIALESHRAQAIVIAEDLGTAPWRFAETLIERDMLGMRVLWFRREFDGGFTCADRYDARAVAMSATHDTPTVAGWWRARDIDWSQTIGRYPSPDDRAADEWHRGEDRAKLWQTIGGDTPQPEPQDAMPVVTAALAHMGRTPSRLAIVPLEDLLADPETPNIPGTIDQHPNWRRRLPAPLDDLLADPETIARIETLDAARKA